MTDDDANDKVVVQIVGTANNKWVAKREHLIIFLIIVIFVAVIVTSLIASL